MALPPRMARASRQALARLGDAARVPWERGPSDPSPGEEQTLLRPIHLVNELVTPEVEYDTWKEFVDLVYLVQDEFCACLAAAVLLDAEHGFRRLSPVLGSVHWFPLNITLARERGPEIIMRLTKQHGLFWCQVVSHFVCSRALRAAAIYDDVRSALDLRDDAPDPHHTSTLTSIMQQEVRHTFSGAMPFSIYTLCSGFVSTLLVKNFTFYADDSLSAFTHRQFEEMLLTLCMGLHPRLGKRSPLLRLDADTLRVVCASLCASELEKHIVFHTQEQWLY